MATKENPPETLADNGVRYDWAQYADGDWYLFEQQIQSGFGAEYDGPYDFPWEVSPSNFAEAARQWGKRNGFKVERRLKNDRSVYLRFTRTPSA